MIFSPNVFPAASRPAAFDIRTRFWLAVAVLRVRSIIARRSFAGQRERAGRRRVNGAMMWLFYGARRHGNRAAAEPDDIIKQSARDRAPIWRRRVECPPVTRCEFYVVVVVDARLRIIYKRCRVNSPPISRTQRR